jgi:hypothetical protein
MGYGFRVDVAALTYWCVIPKSPILKDCDSFKYQEEIFLSATLKSEIRSVRKKTEGASGKREASSVTTRQRC